MNALEDMIEMHLSEVRMKKKANRRLYEQALAQTAECLLCSPETVQDVLFQESIENGDKPSVILEVVHGFLRRLAMHEQPRVAKEP